MLARPPGRPRLLAHRGGRLRAPENTLESLRLARARGADGVEFDVQLSADGEPFLFHDSDGLRVTGARGRVGDLPWPRLRELRVFGRWPVPHLEEALAAVEAWPGAQLFLDLHQDSLRLAEAVARTVAKSSARPRVFVLDFYSARRLLLRVKETEPSVSIAVMPGAPWNADASCALGAQALCLGWDSPLNRRLYRAACAFYDLPAAVARAKARGLEVSGGVANSPEDARYLLAQGIESLWTDDVDLVRKALARG